MNELIIKNIGEIIWGYNQKKYEHERLDLDFLNYMDECDYLDDRVREEADGRVDIYNDDLFNWAKDNTDWIDEARSEFGGGDNILQEIQMGQFLSLEEEIREDLEKFDEYLKGGEWVEIMDDEFITVAFEEMDGDDYYKLKERKEVVIDNINIGLSDLFKD